MANLSKNREQSNNFAAFSIEEFFEKWQVEEANELLWQMLIETLQSPSADAYEAGKLTMLVHDLQQLLAYCKDLAPDLIARYNGLEPDLPHHLSELKRNTEEDKNSSTHMEKKHRLKAA